MEAVSSDPNDPSTVEPGVATTAWPDEQDDTSPAVPDDALPQESPAV